MLLHARRVRGLMKRSKYYFFLDETGDHGLSFVDQNFPLFLLAGCLFEEDELERVQGQINDLKSDIFKTEGVILHSRDIRKCEGAFQVLFDLDLKKNFYERINAILANAHFTIIGAGVNKIEHIKEYGKSARDPYGISLAFIVERLIFCLDAMHDDDAMVDIRIEKRGRKEDEQLLGQYNAILDKGTYYVQSELAKKRISEFQFSSKRDNIIGLQIADLCAYPLARHILKSDEPYVPFQVIEEKIYCNESGKYEGYGLKIFP